MDIEQFIELVRQLRAAQKAYFKDRKQSDLIEARKLEREVDQALADGVIVPILEEMDGEPAEGLQMGLFMEEGQISLLETDEEWQKRWNKEQEQS